MAYIGNGRTLLVLGSNVRDDIVPDNTTQTFNLSQEVPGGYEGNVYVFRQKYILEKIITDGGAFTITVPASPPATTFTITTTGAAAAAVSTIRESLTKFTDSDHTLTITNAVSSNNNNKFVISDCTYDGTTATITLIQSGAQTAGTTTNDNLTLVHGFSGFWEILNPESPHFDYTIGGTGLNLNKQITFPSAPKTEDRLYVVHKGDATYNLVPSDNSVGPNQLTQNLRNFVTQSPSEFTPNGTTTDFTLAQDAVNHSAILVTVNGSVQVGENWNGTSVTANSDYALRTDLVPNRIKFRVAPASGAKIRVLHLGFSTVSRRSVLSPGQTGEVSNNAVGTAQLQNFAVTEGKLAANSVVNSKIADDAISTTKIQDNSVVSSKILLSNNTSIRSFLSNGTTVQNLLYSDASNITNVNAPTQISASIAGTKITNITTGSIASETTETQTLGTSTKKFTDLHLSGTANANAVQANSANIAGNITVSGTVDGVDVSTLPGLINEIVTNLMPIGSITPYSGTASSGVLINSRWLLCDGTPISRTTYSGLNTLYSAGGYRYGAGDGSTTFNIPDLRRRVPIGAGPSDQLGTNEGISNVSLRSLTHDHTVPAHNHEMTHTHTIPGHHHVHDTAVGSSIAITGADSGTHTTTINIGHTHSNNGSTSLHPLSGNATTNGSIANITLTDPGHGHHWGATANTYYGNYGGPAPAAGVTRTPSTYTSSPATPLSGAAGNTRSWSETYGGSGASTHSHGGGTTSGGEHTHTLRIWGTGNSSHNHETGSITYVSTRANNGSAQTDGGVIQGPSQGNHSHSISTDSRDLDHVHSISAAATGMYIDQTSHTHSIPAHSHGIPDIILSSTSNLQNRNNTSAIGVTASTNDGSHTHATGAFSGSIGKVTGGNNGNNDLTTNSQNVSTTSNSAVLTSGTQTNTPHLILNYIVRVL